MPRILTRALWLIAPLVLLVGVSRAPAASYGVRDNAHFFSSDALKQADEIINQIEQRHQHDLLVETLPAIPDDQRQAMQANPRAFWDQYVNDHARAAGVRGVYVIISKDPPHIQAGVGSSTRQRLFTESDRDQLVQKIAGPFKQHNFDQGLLDGVRFVQQRMDENVPTSSGSPMAGQRGSSGYPVPTRVVRPSWGVGSVACVVIGVVLVILVVRGIFGRSGSGYGGGGYYPPGGYPQGGAPAGYPPAGGYYGGGGGGFGRGFLGGLLGGALGGYAADRWMHPGQGQTGGYVPPATGGGDPSSGADTSFSSSGADFGSSSSGADFGGGGGGADFGGGGADFGGGGGGSDFGGGGDAGGSSGSDF